MNDNYNSNIFKVLKKKAELKQEVYSNTIQTFKIFKKVIKSIKDDYDKTNKPKQRNTPFEYKIKSEFEIELKFGGDILIFMMHTNVFEFPRSHEVMKTSYIKEDHSRSYCGIINIYNFLGDSFKYNRINDIGYLIGRVFVNKDRHYFIEGESEISLLFNNFVNLKIDENEAKKIIESAILYTINFDLLTPPFDAVKEVSVYEIKTTIDNMKMKTGKRLGFKFQIEDEKTKNIKD